MSFRACIGACTACVAIVWTVHAGAGEDPAAADALFRRAKAHLDAGRIDEACASFEESYRLERAAGTMLNLANCEEKRGRLARALEHYRAAKDALAPGDFRQAFVGDRIRALDGRVPRLVVHVPEKIRATATIYRDDVLLGPASWGVALPVDPGPHLVTLRRAGHADVQVRVELGAGERREIAVDAAEPDGHAHPSASPRSGDRGGKGGVGRRSVGIVTAGVGLGLLTVGTITGVMTISAATKVRNHCDDAGRCDAEGLDAASTGRTVEIVSPVTLALGALGVGAGAYLYLTAPPARAREQVHAWTLTPAVDARSGSIVLSRPF